MIKVAALTSGKTTPSARFRIRQHIQPLRDCDIKVTEHIPAIDKNEFIPSFAKGLVPKYDKPIRAMMLGAKVVSRLPGYLGSQTSQITWLNRELIPGRCLIEPLLKKPLVFDVDDAVWLASASSKSAQRSYADRVSQSIAAIAQNSSVVMAGNSYLANWFEKYNQNIKIIPTAIDVDRFAPNPQLESSEFIVGWTGSAGNLGYLYQIEAPLKKFLTSFKDTKLLVVGDKAPSFKSLPAEKVRYLPWSPEVEAQAVQQMNVGLMPLADNEWTRGKCSFKMLQYMACQIPVIVSPVGMNADLLTMEDLGVGAVGESDWYDALTLFYRDRTLAKKYGVRGRAIAVNHFSQQVVTQKIAEVFRELV